MRKALILILAATMCSILVFGSCSSDKKTPTEGSPNDQSYLEAQAFARGFVDSLSVYTLEGFSYMNFDGTRALKFMSDSSSLNFDGSTFWWVIYASHDTTGISITARDSVRFEEGDHYTMLPDSLLTTGIDCRTSLVLNMQGDSTILAADIGRTFHATGIQSPQVVFNGSDAADISGSFGSVESILYSYSASETDVTFNRVDLDESPRPHPIAGAIAMALTIHAVSPEGTINANWTIDITFFMDHYHIHFVSGDNFWDWDGPYGA